MTSTPMRPWVTCPFNESGGTTTVRECGAYQGCRAKQPAA